MTPLTLVVLDVDDREHARLEAAAEQLGVDVLALDPEDLPADAVGEFAAACAALIAWDLGVRPGLDLAESLARDARTADVAVAMVAEAPTRAMVQVALRAGARTFFTRPVELDALGARLLDAAVAEARARAGDEAEAPAEAESEAPADEASADEEPPAAEDEPEADAARAGDGDS